MKFPLTEDQQKVREVVFRRISDAYFPRSLAAAEFEGGFWAVANEVMRLMEWAREQGAHEGHNQATHVGLTTPPNEWTTEDPIPDAAKRRWDGGGR